MYNFISITTFMETTLLYPYSEIFLLSIHLSRKGTGKYVINIDILLMFHICVICRNSPTPQEVLENLQVTFK